MPVNTEALTPDQDPLRASDQGASKGEIQS